MPAVKPPGERDGTCLDQYPVPSCAEVTVWPLREMVSSSLEDISRASISHSEGNDSPGMMSRPFHPVQVMVKDE